MHSTIDAASVAAFHDRQLRNPDWPIFDDAQSGAWTWIAANHRYNGLLWREEDRARRLDVPPTGIAAGKRLIDRLSILALKIHQMRVQARRHEAGPDHMHACACKLERLLAQREDLMSCLDSLLAEARAGQAFFKVYRQFKMYNDPSPAEQGHQ